MPRKCSIQNCPSKIGHSPNLSFFKLPSDPSLASIWLQNLRFGLPQNFTVERCRLLRICSLHFADNNCYLSGGRRLLVKNAIPKLISSPLRDDERIMEPDYEIEEMEEDPDSDDMQENEELDQLVEDCISGESSTSKASFCDFTSAEILELEKKLAYAKRELNKLRRYPPASFIIEHLDVLKSHVSEEAYILFTSAVKNHKLDPNGRRHTDASKSLANTIGCRNGIALNLFREYFALPSSRTLDRFNKDLFSTTGISVDTKNALKRHSLKLKPEDKFAILSFDETDIKPGYTYLPRQDSVDGYEDLGSLGRSTEVAEKVLVFGLRGCNDRWKQIISYYFVSKKNFNTTKLKYLVEENLKVVFEAGFHVVATVCDGDAKNQSLFTAFSVDPTSSSYDFEEKKIQFLHDVPHIIKLIRNNLMNYNLVCDFGTEAKGIVKWNEILSHLEPIVSNPNILSFCPKLTKAHLKPNGFEKMRVKLATQLFSHSVTSSFAYAVCKGHAKSEEYKLIVELFRKLDTLFDVLNSSSTSLQDGKPWKTALKLHDSLIPFLESFDELIANDRLYYLRPYPAAGKNSQVKCLKMLSITIRGIITSAKFLFQNGVERVFTRRFCQDILENHFAFVKMQSSHLTTTFYRLRFRQSMILYSQNHPPSANCENDEDHILFDEDDCDTESVASTIDSRSELSSFLSSFNSELSEFSEFCEAFQDDDTGEGTTCLNNSQIEAASTDVGLITYIAGYIARRIKNTKVSCDDCYSSLAVDVDLAQHHQYTHLRNFTNENSLIFPSANLTKVTVKSCSILEKEVPNLIAVIGVKYHLFKLLWGLDYSFIPTCHHSAVKIQIIRRLINMFIGKHLKDLKAIAKATKTLRQVQKKRQISGPCTSQSVPTFQPPPPL